MHLLLESKLPEISALCRRFHVRRLEVFGSAARSGREPRDFDLLVEFDPAPGMGAADQYFGLLAALEEVLNKPVQLLIRRSLRNPHLIRSITATKVPLYVAENAEAS